ncbi:MAG: DUF624 domain-containing protein [Oscillospiraceae bacterium]|nr:DUF624 domain-containing protein [Oscillospiraceae bacterium]
MGLFSPNYNKPGPGVDVNEPPKRRFFLFLELFFRKFTKLIHLNFLYAITLIPAFVILFFLGALAFAPLFENLAPLILEAYGEYGDEVLGTTILYMNLLFPLMILCLWGGGPTTAGFAYVLRNYSREEHSWINSDFFEHTRKNFKQSIVVFAIDLVVIFVFYIGIMFYSAQTGAMFFMTYVLLLFLVIYTLMHLYIYPMMVTFDLSLRALYKNALMFALMKLVPNLIIAAVIIAIVIGLAQLIFPFGLFFAVPIILFSLCGYISVFWTYPTLEKYMMHADEAGKSDNDLI